jgi:uncharacterized protein YlxW (UPF0749 family)
MLSVQFKTHQALSTALEYQGTEALVAIWKELNNKKDLLEQELTYLREREAALSRTSVAGETTRDNLRQELTKLQLACGLLPARGPGITVTFSGDTPLLSLDLVDLINELWASGAEAIAINDLRVTGLTSVGEVRERGEYRLTVDGRKLNYPIVVKAIGDPDNLEKGLTFPGGLIDNFNTLYAIYPRIEKRAELAVPAAPPVAWKYSHPKDASTSASAAQ